MTQPVLQRRQYRPDGGWLWSRLPVLVLMPLAVCLALAVLMTWLFHAGWYLVVIVPMVVAALLAASLYWAVGFAHCRKPWFATMLGLVCGAITYLGYFHLDMVSMLGPQAIHRVDLLPSYIQLRMTTDVQNEVGRPDVDGNAPEPTTGMNWFTFIYESGIIMGVATVFARRRATRAYDSQMGCWMVQETRVYPHGARQPLIDALQTDRLGEFAAAFRPLMGQAKEGGCSVTLEYTQHDDVSPLERPVYLTASETPIRTWIASLVSPSSLFLQREVEREETLELMKVFPNFSTLLQLRHEQLRESVYAVEAGSESEPESASSAVATIENVKPQEVVTPFKGKHLLAENLCGGAPLLMIGGGIGMIYVASTWLAPFGLPVVIAVSVVATIAILAGGYIAMACPMALERLYTLRLLRNSFQHRASVLVDGRDTEAEFVVLTKRENWESVKLEVATDAGFAKYDPRAGALLMECGLETYRIPVESIRSSGIEFLLHPMDPKTEHWMVNLSVRTPTGPRELMICDSTPLWSLGNNRKRREKAEALRKAFVGETSEGPASRKIVRDWGHPHLKPGTFPEKVAAEGLEPPTRG